MGSFPETKNDPNFSSVDCSEGGGGIRVAKEGGGGDSYHASRRSWKNRIKY